MIGEILTILGIVIFGIAAFLKWIIILIDCFSLGDYGEGVLFFGLGLFFTGIVILFLQATLF